MNGTMGLESSKENSDSLEHLPSTVYRPLRESGDVIPPPYTIIKELKHSGPLGVDQPLRISACSFAVNDDAMLISLSTFPVLETSRPFRAGFVQSWDLNDVESGHDDSLFTYSPRPVLSMSPDGTLLCAILNSGRRQLILVEKEKDCTLEPCKIECISRTGDENLSARTACCVFAPNGTIAVTISNVTLSILRGVEVNEMCLWKVHNRVLQSRWKASCEVFLPNFSGYLISCVFSPDSSLLAVSTSNGQLYIIRSENLDVFESIKTDSTQSNKCMCEFDPRYANNKLSACFSNGTFEVWRLDQEHTRCLKSRKITEDPHKITSFTYSPDGTLIAFGISDCTVHIYETEFYKCVYKLNPQNIEGRVFTGHQVCSVSFPKTCQELAVGYDDGYICIWQLPVKMDLQHMCRVVINQIVPANRIHRLPLPKALIAYLLYSYLNIEDWSGN